MNSGQTIFRQPLQFLCLAYAQMSGRESLREIETCLNSHGEKLYRIGFRGSVSPLYPG